MVVKKVPVKTFWLLTIYLVIINLPKYYGITGSDVSLFTSMI